MAATRKEQDPVTGLWSVYGAQDEHDTALTKLLSSGDTESMADMVVEGMNDEGYPNPFRYLTKADFRAMALALNRTERMCHVAEYHRQRQIFLASANKKSC